MAQESPGRIDLFLRAFRHRNYRLFFGGQLVSLIGTFLTQLATVWFVYRLTHSAWLLGVAGFAGQIPMFALAPFGGVWVDRWNRRRLLVITQTLSMLQSFGLAVVAFWYPSVWGIILLSLVQGLINAFDMPGRQAFLVEMVTDRQDLANAIALNSTMVHTARLIGPAMAGLLIAIVGEGWCFTLDGISYIGVIAALLAMRLQAHKTKKTARRGALHELREGFSYAWNFFPVRALLLLTAFVSLTGMPAYSVLMPIFAGHFAPHGSGALILGILMGASGFGALVGAISLASRRTVVGLGRMIWISAAIFGSALIVFACSRTFWFSLCIVPFAGFGMLMVFAAVNTLLQTLVEDDKRGRVMSLFSMAFVGMTPWGNLLSGAVAQHAGKWSATPRITGAAITIAAAGALCLVAAGLFGKVLPVIRKIVRPIYIKKGIIPEIAGGLSQSTQLDLPATSQT